MALVARMKRSAIRAVHRAHASRIGIRATACNRHCERSAVIHGGAAWKKMDPCHRTKKTNPVQVNLLGFEAKVLVTKYLAHLIKQVLGLGKIGDRVHRIKTRYETWYRRRKP